MIIPCIGVDRKEVPKRNSVNEMWAIALVKFDNGDIAEVFLDSESCPHFEMGASLSLECGLSVFNKKLGIKCTSLHPRTDTGKEK